MEEFIEDKNTEGISDRSFKLALVTVDVQYNIKDVVRTAGDPRISTTFRRINRPQKTVIMLSTNPLQRSNFKRKVKRQGQKCRTNKSTNPFIQEFTTRLKADT